MSIQDEIKNLAKSWGGLEEHKINVGGSSIQDSPLVQVLIDLISTNSALVGGIMDATVTEGGITFTMPVRFCGINLDLLTCLVLYLERTEFFVFIVDNALKEIIRLSMYNNREALQTINEEEFASIVAGVTFSNIRYYILEQPDYSKIIEELNN